MDWHIPKIQGAAGNFDFTFNEQGQLEVTNKKTNEQQIAHQTTSGKYRISIYDEAKQANKYRYFTPEDLLSYQRREQIKDIPPEVLKIRANVEATIRQVFCTLNGNKSRYVGLTRNHWFVLCRVMWVNFRRIEAFFTKMLPYLTLNKVYTNIKLLKKVFELVINFRLFFRQPLFGLN